MKSTNSECSIAELAAKIGAAFIGNAKAKISGFCSLEEPLPGCIAFSRERRPAKIKQILEGFYAGALILDASLTKQAFPPESNIIFAKDPQAALIALYPLFHCPREISRTISPKADIHPSVKLGKDVSVGPFCVLGQDVEIGDQAVVHPNVVVYPGARIGRGAVIHSGAIVREDCEIGAGCIVQNGAVIGADGFGYLPTADGLQGVPQIGNVVLADKVDIGANSCVDRAALGSTKVGTGTKIDNLVQVGHNCQIGQNSILCGQVGLAGSVTVGDGVVLGGNAGVRDHVKIASGARVAAKAGVTRDLKKGDYAGYPAVKASFWKREAIARQRRSDAESNEGESGAAGMEDDENSAI